jgi:hypothetical protein
MAESFPFALLNNVKHLTIKITAYHLFLHIKKRSFIISLIKEIFKPVHLGIFLLRILNFLKHLSNLLLSAFCFQPSAFCFQPFAFSFLLSALFSLPLYTPSSYHVRDLFEKYPPFSEGVWEKLRRSLEGDMDKTWIKGGV